MDLITTYGYKDFTDINFPFDIKMRKNNNFPHIKHMHNSLQICYVHKGSCIHHMYDNDCILVKGDIIVVPSHIIHELRTIPNTEIELIQLDFMPFIINENMTDSGENICDLLDFAYMQAFTYSKLNKLARLNISSSIQLIIESLFLSMKDEFENKKETYKLSIKADLLKLLVILIREFKEPYNEKIRNQTTLCHNQTIKTIIDYLELNYTNDISLEDIALIAHMSPSYISHIFKIVEGTTFIECLNNIRINKAIDLLRSTAKSITLISSSVGFKSICHFNKMFTRTIGSSPSNYRKNSTLSHINQKPL